MEIKQKQPPAGGGGGVPSTGTVDIGAAFSFLTKDPQWVQKAGMMGLITLIPIVGYVVLLGWCREIFERVRAGEDTLPSLDFGKQLEKGWAPFLAVFSVGFGFGALIFVLQLFTLPFALIGEATRGTGIETIAGLIMGLIGLLVGLLAMVGALGLNVAMPELIRRGFTGESFPIASPKLSIAAIKANSGAYIMVVLGAIVFNMLGSVGVMACYVGMFVTIPLGLVGMTHMIAQWQKLVDEQA